MAVSFNHCIIVAKDARVRFVLHDAVRAAGAGGAGPFLSAALDSVFIQVAALGIAVQPRRYAFLVTEEEFDAIHQRIVDTRLEYRADPAGHCRGHSTPTTAGATFSSAFTLVSA